MKQTERLLGYLCENESITSLQALNELGIFRLASRINDLRKMGYKISGKMEKVENRFGEEIFVKRYFLENA